MDPCSSVFIRGYPSRPVFFRGDRCSSVAIISGMGKRSRVLVLALLVWSALPAAEQSPLVETVGDTGFLQLQAPSFAQLSPKQKQLAYWLVQASIAIDPIVYDQLSPYGVRLKRLLEGIVARRPAVPADSY